MRLDEELSITRTSSVTRAHDGPAGEFRSGPMAFCEHRRTFVTVVGMLARSVPPRRHHGVNYEPAAGKCTMPNQKSSIFETTRRNCPRSTGFVR